MRLKNFKSRIDRIESKVGFGTHTDFLNAMDDKTLRAYIEAYDEGPPILVDRLGWDLKKAEQFMEQGRSLPCKEYGNWSNDQLIAYLLEN